jgi:hypothetical protein
MKVLDAYGAKEVAQPANKLHQRYQWMLTWISLPAALMWWVTRDNNLTRTVQLDPDAYANMKMGVSVRLASAQVYGQRVGIVERSINEAWPAIRRSIADEKIVAEGKSLERRGINSTVETRFPNERIPSGDAGSLIIMRGVPGIEPKDALAPDEFYRFTNCQGRYWYDVRLRAADLFREFPELCRPAGDAESDQSKEQQPKSRRGRTKGAGSYAHLDGPLLDEMQTLIEKGEAVSPEAASHLVAAKAKGAGTVESKAERLAKRYRASRNFDRNKSD